MDILFPDCCLFLFFLLVSLDLAVNRLDRLTSGLMIAALSRTLYSLFFFIMSLIIWSLSGITECHEPIHVASFKLTLNTVHPDGKACSTIFELLRYDPNTNTSIILARPVTGRTHQIRVHLQWLGYPITNDPPLSQQRDLGTIQWQRRNQRGAGKGRCSETVGTNGTRRRE